MFRSDCDSEASAQIAHWWRVVEICLPSHAHAGPASFLPSGAERVDEDWDFWAEQFGAPIFAPSFASLYAAAVSTGELLVVDAAMGAALPEEMARRSLMLGRSVLSDFLPPRGMKILERLSRAADTDSSQGHLITVFAVRAHGFHIPAIEAFGAFLLMECVLGASAVGVTLPASRIAEMLRRARAASRVAPACKPVAI